MYNLFKNMDAVDIKVFFSDLLAEEKVNHAKKIIKELRFSTGEIKPKIAFMKMSLELKLKDPVKKKDDSIGLKDIFNWLSEFGNAFGIIMATVLFGIIARKLLKLWEEIMQNLAAKPEEEVPEEEESP